MSFEFYLIVVFICTIIPLMFIWWVWKGDDIKLRFFIENHVIPIYDELELEYGAKYPNIMVKPICNAFKEFLPYKERNLTFYFFVKNNSFVIVKEMDPNFHIEIPFSDVICQWCTYDQYKKCFDIDFHFMYNSKIEKLCFSTITYNHKLDKKYGDCLTGEEIFEFIRNTFTHQKEYEKTHGYDSLP